MPLHEELGFPNRLRNPDHEALLGILVTAELLKKEATVLFTPLGITGAQFNVLILLLAQSPDGSLSQVDLARMLTVNRANITGLVDRLETLGLVARGNDPSDRRINRVALTDAGRTIAEEAQTRYIDHIHTLMADLGPAGWEVLAGMLENVRKSVSTLNQTGLKQANR